MKYKHFALTCMVFICSFSHSQNTGMYSGSQAFNKTQPEQVSVNAATGTFDFSYSLINNQGRVAPFHLQLVYRHNIEGMFGMPSGWRLDLDYIDNKTAHIHGQQWLIDPLWHDEKGFASGLKYYNQHGTRFIDEGVTREIPQHKGLFYRYLATHKDGSNKYFSHQGLLILEKDRFNNTLTFEYQQPVKSLTEARLTKITDNYGNDYRFSYAPNEVILHYPDDKTVYLYFNESGVSKIINPINQSTYFTYIRQDDKHLLRTIESNSGLITRVVYDTINYKSQSEVKKMPVVTQLTQYDKGAGKTLRETHYTYTEGNNFTGYPFYELSQDSDSLIDSNNQGFRYSVEVSESNLSPANPQNHTRIFYYNYLHLPTEVHTLNNGDSHLKTVYEYAISPFKYSRSTNYDKPVSVTNHIWDKDHNAFIPTNQTTHTYDAFGNTLTEIHSAYDRLYSQWTPLSSKYNTYFTDNYSLKASTIQTDEITGKFIKDDYSLSTDGKTHTMKSTGYKFSKNDKTYRPWKQTRLNHDESGRVILTTKEWTAKNKPGIVSTSTKVHYAFNTKTRYLTQRTETALGSVSSSIMDTRNNNTVSRTTPLNEAWRFDYDPIGRQIKTTNPKGQEIRIQYQDFQNDNTNSKTVSTPLGYKKRVIFDALGQVTHHQDYLDNHWRDLTTYQYDSWGLVTAETNKLGLKTVNEYDEQKRPLKSIDAWGNIKSFAYNDLALTTTAYLNKHKTHEKISVPWLATLHERSFPVFDNPHDPQDYYVEKTTQKNGFNEIIQQNSTLVHRQTREKSEPVTTDRYYDASHNLVEQKTTGYDGTILHRSIDYDLLNNAIKQTKTITDNNEQHVHQSETRSYNEDNLLTEIASPFLLCGSMEVTRFEYDKNGNKIKTILPDGHTVSFAYDSLGLLTESGWQRGTTPYRIQHNYDADQRLTETRDSTGQSISYRYTANGLMTQQTYPDNRSLSYRYDDKDRIVHITDFNKTAQTYTYKPEDHGKLSMIQQHNNRVIFDYGTDDNGHRGHLTQRTLLLEKEGKTESTFHYGALNRIAKSNTINQQAGAVYNTAYAFNPRGQMTSQTTHAHRGLEPTEEKSIHYSYDSLNRLIQEHSHSHHDAVTIDYRYDANNNLIDETTQSNNCTETTHYTYNALDQLVSSSNNHQPETLYYQYSTNGHMISDGLGNQYQYDDRGFLLEVTSADHKATHYQYLPDGLLSQKQSDTSHVKFYHDHHKSIITQNTNDRWLSLIRHGRGIIAGVSSDGVDQVFRAHQSTGAILSFNGTLTTHSYQAYGDHKNDSVHSATDNYHWNQEFNDPDTRLTYLQSRFYSPAIRRFISKDSYSVGNRYAFAKANPVTYIDPTGHNAQQAVSYGLGSTFTALGIFGAIMAIPTGGASLTLSAGSALVSGVSSALSGISLMASQGALDSGNKEVAKALQYTSIALSVASVVTGGYAVASRFLGASSAPLSNASSFADLPSVHNPVDTVDIESISIKSGGTMTSSPTSISQPGSIPESPSSQLAVSPDSIATNRPSSIEFSRRPSWSSDIGGPVWGSQSGLNEGNQISQSPSAASLFSQSTGSESSATYPRFQVYVNGHLITPTPAQNWGPAPAFFPGGESLAIGLGNASDEAEELFYEDMSGTMLIDDASRSNLTTRSE